MQRDYFWYPTQVRDLGAPPTGSRVGQLLFLSAQFPRHLESGKVIRTLWDLPPNAFKALQSGMEHRDGREGPIKAQAWTIYTNLQTILEQQGSSLDNVVRQRIYLTSPTDISPMEEVMLSFFRNEKPATTITCTSNVGVHPDLLMQVEVTAFIPQAEGLDKKAIYVPELKGVTWPYPQAVRVGQLLFFSGIRGIHPDTGRVATRLRELSPEIRQLQESGLSQTDACLEPLKTQVGLMFSHMRDTLKTQGGTIDDLVRQNFFDTQNMGAWGIASHPFRSRLFTHKQTAPTSAAFEVPTVDGDPSVELVSDALALLPGPWEKRAVLLPEFDMSYLPMVKTAGPFVFNTGYIAMDKGRHGPITAFTDLPDQAKYLGLSRPDNSETIMAQAWHIYAALAKMMEAGGSDLAHAVQQTIYLRDANLYSAVERVAGVFYDRTPPPTTVIPVSGIGPYPGLEIEVEVICVVD